MVVMGIGDVDVFGADLGTARASLAMPPYCQVRRRGCLGIVDHVQHHHAFVHWHRVAWYVPPPSFVPRKTCKMASAMSPRSFETSQQLFQVFGDLRAPHILTDHTILLLTHHGVDVFQGICRLRK